MSLKITKEAILKFCPAKSVAHLRLNNHPWQLGSICSHGHHRYKPSGLPLTLKQEKK